MSIVVTGATGHLGRLVVEGLLARGVPAERVVATGRRTAAIGDLAERGVTVRHADFDDPGTLAEAFAGGEKLLLVSAPEAGRRLPQHRAAVDAAKEAAVSLIVYTSAPKADRTRLKLAAEHAATEAYIRESGVPFAFLRNCWYLENYTDRLETQLSTGTVVGATGGGRFSVAARADYAEAAAAVLAADDQAGAVYELGGDDITLAEYAAEVTRQSGRTVVYQDLPVETYAEMLVGFGVPQQLAEILADADAGIARGDLLTGLADLSRLIGRPPTGLAEGVAAALN